jgi:CRISPR-associated protein Cas8a1/Csx13
MAQIGRRKTKYTERSAPLVIGLADPGLTPMLRAGLGGLAASVRAIATAKQRAWPAAVAVGSGRVIVEPRSVQIDWGAEEPLETLRALFEASFRISKQGIIDLPGTYDRRAPLSVEVAAALQDSLKRTFLQHGKSTQKHGIPQTRRIEIDDVPATLSFQPYSAFRHQDAFTAIGAALRTGAVTLASWAYPGAVARHIAAESTDLRYDAKSAICACFAIVGCLSYQVPRTGGGALIIPEPTDLVRFAVARPRLTPRVVREVYVPGAADGVLTVHLALRMDEVASADGGIGNVLGIQLKTLPWAPQQKSRCGLISSGTFTGAELDKYDRVRKTLPNRLRIRKNDGTMFPTSSALRGFIAENLARHERWYTGFATATDGGPDGRFLHYYGTRDNLGALFIEEKEGLVAMLDELEAAEFALIRTIHSALRNRFAAIADETEGNPVTRKRRWRSERDRWRYVFAGSKTAAQIRAALADMWSRAGRNPELQEHWQEVVPLLRPVHWRAARDLALVALASYQGVRGQEARGDDSDDAEGGN